MGVITFNNIASTTVGIEVETYPEYVTPEREYEAIHVPGRNGDIVIDTGSYKDTTRTYTVSIAVPNNTQYYKQMNKVAEWLQSGSGFCRLEDSYEPDFYTLAYYKPTTSFDNIFNQAGKGLLKFTCKPQRFLKSGESVTTYTSAGTIQNGTKFASLPIVEITTNNSAGTVVIGNYTISVKANAGTITVNSDTQDVYSGTLNKNSYITLINGAFPKLDPGSNTISFSGGVTKVKVTPRWWTI